MDLDEATILLGSQDEYPSQDGVDRRDHFVIIASLDFANDQHPIEYEDLQRIRLLNRGLGSLLEQTADDAMKEILPNSIDAPPSATYYQVGPAAEGLFHHEIITLWEGARQAAPLLGSVADVWAVVEIVRRIAARLHSQETKIGKNRLRPRLSFSAYTLVKLCEDHVRKSYHPRARLTSEWYSLTENYFAGYTSPAHPTGSEQYLITVTTRQRTYCYKVDGHGTVATHYYRQGRRMIPLLAPKLV